MARPMRQFRVLVVAVAGALVSASAAEDGQVRPAYCAGQWYPGEAAALGKTVDDLLAQAKPPELAERPVALICPHAGYRYCAPVSAAAYASLRGQSYKRVIVLAFSHRNAGRYRGVDVPLDLAAYATPLGEVPIDRAACEQLRQSRVYVSQSGVDVGEHSLELQLPFLQRLLKGFLLVPLNVGQMGAADCTLAAQALLPLIDEQTLLVASTDFTHFGPNFDYEPFREDVPNKLRELADRSAAAIVRCDYDSFTAHCDQTKDTICGRGPVGLLLHALAMQGGARGVRAAYDTSGNVTGDWTNSVTYQSFVLTQRPGVLDHAERAELLRLARLTATAYLKRVDLPAVDEAKLPARLRTPGACFVTLENHGALRGCIGNMIAGGPLYQAVMENARRACRDYRFVDHPVTAAELDQIRIEISYLTPMQRVTDPNDIVVGQHGLLIGLGSERGVLLPQVAYERGWSRAEFLAQTCHKAGLPPDAWKNKDAEIQSFEAEVFGEDEK